jgi:hypothetical protein
MSNGTPLLVQSWPPHHRSDQVNQEILDEKATFVNYYSEAETGQESPPSTSLEPTGSAAEKRLVEK